MAQESNPMAIANLSVSVCADTNGQRSFPISSCAVIRIDNKRNVIPARPTQRHLIELSPLDLQLLSIYYNQKAVFYCIPPADFSLAVELLAKSLSEILVTFYPLAGRLSTSEDGVVCIDCNDAGTEFIEASTADIGIADMSAIDVTPTIQDLFPLSSATNLKGDELPLMAVQLTKLRDGIAVGCTINHAIADGTSFWHFLNSWTELCAGKTSISVDPIHNRRLISSGLTVPLNLGMKEDVSQYSPPPLRVKTFCFSKETLKGLKEEASRGSPVPISSLKALCAHVWKAVTRARGLDPDEATSFGLSVNCRSRLVPPLPSEYFGNAIQIIWVTLTAEELEKNGISYPAGLLQGMVEGHGNKVIRERIDAWQRDPIPIRFEKLAKNILKIGSSPWFRMYENDFGWGEPVAVRSGLVNNVDGKANANPGKEGRGSVELEICLAPHAMEALETDQCFLSPFPTQCVLDFHA